MMVNKIKKPVRLPNLLWPNDHSEQRNWYDLQSQLQWWKCRTPCKCHQQIEAANMIFQLRNLRSGGAWIGSRCNKSIQEKRTQTLEIMTFDEKIPQCRFVFGNRASNAASKRKDSSRHFINYPDIISPLAFLQQTAATKKLNYAGTNSSAANSAANMQKAPPRPHNQYAAFPASSAYLTWN